MVNLMDGFLVLEDGTMYTGQAFGRPKNCFFEIVFNTGMAGYTEIISDPGFGGQGLVMTFPAIGNHGVCRSETQSSRLALSALIVREFHDGALDPRADLSLDAWLKEEDVPGLWGIDTRSLTGHLRDNGTMRAALCFETLPDIYDLLRDIREWQMPEQVPLAGVSEAEFFKRTVAGDERSKHIAVIDYGIKQGLIKQLNRLGADVTLLPYDVTARQVIATGCDGVLLGSGPGDPKACPEQIEVIGELLTHGKPLMAIGLGHQMLCLAAGLDTEKMSFGHRGSSHPVRSLRTGRLYQTSQNHSYVVSRHSLEPSMQPLEIIFEHVNDDTVEGVRFTDRKIRSYQFHPEERSGPSDTFFVLQEFFDDL